MSKNQNTAPSTNDDVLAGLNAAVKAKRETAAETRKAHLAAKAELREAVGVRDSVYKMLGLDVPESEDEDNSSESDES